MKTGKTVNIETAVPEADKTDVPDAMNKQVTPRRTEVRLGRETQARIGQQLRAIYDEVVREGVPQHIADLVHRLSERDEANASNQDDAQA